VNGVKDGDETDVDCGGDDCAPCQMGQQCTLGSDCRRGTCTSDTCTSYNSTCVREPLTDDEIENLFDRTDRNNDGTFSYGEFHHFVRGEEFQEIVASRNGTGFLGLVVGPDCSSDSILSTALLGVALGFTGMAFGGIISFACGRRREPKLKNNDAKAGHLSVSGSEGKTGKVAPLLPEDDTAGAVVITVLAKESKPAHTQEYDQSMGPPNRNGRDDTAKESKPAHTQGYNQSMGPPTKGLGEAREPSSASVPNRLPGPLALPISKAAGGNSSPPRSMEIDETEIKLSMCLEERLSLKSEIHVLTLENARLLCEFEQMIQSQPANASQEGSMEIDKTEIKLRTCLDEKLSLKSEIHVLTLEKARLCEFEQMIQSQSANAPQERGENKRHDVQVDALKSSDSSELLMEMIESDTEPTEPTGDSDAELVAAKGEIERLKLLLIENGPKAAEEEPPRGGDPSGRRRSIARNSIAEEGAIQVAALWGEEKKGGEADSAETAKDRVPVVELPPRAQSAKGFAIDWAAEEKLDPLVRLTKAQLCCQNLELSDLELPREKSLPYLESALKRASLLTGARSRFDSGSLADSRSLQKAMSGLEPQDASKIEQDVILEAEKVSVAKDDATMSSEFANVADTLENFNQATIAEANLARVVEAINNSRREVLRIKRGNIDELRSMNKPPKMCVDILLAVMSILNDDCRTGGWKMMKKRMTKGSVFLREIFNYDATSLSASSVMETKTIFAKNPDDYRPEVIAKKGSAALPPLFSWVQSMISFFDQLQKANPDLKEQIIKRVRAAYKGFVEDASLEGPNQLRRSVSSKH